MHHHHFRMVDEIWLQAVMENAISVDIELMTWKLLTLISALALEQYAKQDGKAVLGAD